MTEPRMPGRSFAEGSMGLIVQAADTFVEQTGRVALIDSITETPALLRGGSEAPQEPTPTTEEPQPAAG